MNSKNSETLLSLCFSCDDKNLDDCLESINKVIELSDKVEAVVIVQNLFGTYDGKGHKSEKVRIVLQEGRGLSRSRNLAISMAEGNFCWILDGDIQFNQKDFIRLLSILKRNKNAAPLTYSVQVKCLECDGLYKKYRLKKHYFRWDMLKISSIEIIINKSMWNAKGVPFDERIGLGTRYPGTEEVDFLLRLHSNKVDHKGLDITPLSHTCLIDNRQKPKWEIFYARGALLRKLGLFAPLACCYWLVKFFLKYKNIYFLMGMIKGLIFGLGHKPNLKT